MIQYFYKYKYSIKALESLKCFMPIIFLFSKVIDILLQMDL